MQLWLHSLFMFLLCYNVRGRDKEAEVLVYLWKTYPTELYTSLQIPTSLHSGRWGARAGFHCHALSVREAASSRLTSMHTWDSFRWPLLPLSRRIRIDPSCCPLPPAGRTGTPQPCSSHRSLLKTWGMEQDVAPAVLLRAENIFQCGLPEVNSPHSHCSSLSCHFPLIFAEVPMIKQAFSMKPLTYHAFFSIFVLLGLFCSPVFQVSISCKYIVICMYLLVLLHFTFTTAL